MRRIPYNNDNDKKIEPYVFDDFLFGALFNYIFKILKAGIMF